MLLLGVAPRHVQLPRRLRAVLRLHLQLWHLLLRIAPWRELEVHALRSHGDMRHVTGPRDWHAEVGPSLMWRMLRRQALMRSPKSRGWQHSLARLHD